MPPKVSRSLLSFDPNSHASHGSQRPSSKALREEGHSRFSVLYYKSKGTKKEQQRLEGLLLVSFGRASLLSLEGDGSTVFVQKGSGLSPCKCYQRMEAAKRGVEWRPEVEIPFGLYTVCIVETLQLHLIPSDERLPVEGVEERTDRAAASAGSVSLGTKGKPNLLHGVTEYPPTERLSYYPSPNTGVSPTPYCDTDYNCGIQRLLRGKVPRGDAEGRQSGSGVVFPSQTRAAPPLPYVDDGSMAFPPRLQPPDPKSSPPLPPVKRSREEVLSMMERDFSWP